MPGRPSRLADGRRELQLFVRERLAVRPERPVGSAPLIPVEYADLLERLGDDPRGGLIEEHDPAGGVDTALGGVLTVVGADREHLRGSRSRGTQVLDREWHARIRRWPFVVAVRIGL